MVLRNRDRMVFAYTCLLPDPSVQIIMGIMTFVISASGVVAFPWRVLERSEMKVYITMSLGLLHGNAIIFVSNINIIQIDSHIVFFSNYIDIF